MKIGELSASEIEKKLRSSGLAFQAGPFTISVQANTRAITKPFKFLYADFNICEDNGFADFHVEIKKRRWWRPQVLFWLDGKTPFYPLWGHLGMPLFEWGLNWCISNFAHQYLVIHSAVLEKNGRAIVISGPAGSGKSTLAAGLAFSGWRLLSDELTMVSREDGQIAGMSRPVSLKNESIRAIQNLAPETYTHLDWHDPREGTVALVVPPKDSVDRVSETALPKWIIFVSYQAGTLINLQPVPKSRAFLRIAGNSLNYSLLGAAGFETMADVVDRCNCYEFTYSDIKEAIRCLGQLTG